MTLGELIELLKMVFEMIKTYFSKDDEQGQDAESKKTK